MPREAWVCKANWPVHCYWQISPFLCIWRIAVSTKLWIRCKSITDNPSFPHRSFNFPLNFSNTYLNYWLERSTMEENCLTHNYTTQWTGQSLNLIHFRAPPPSFTPITLLCFTGGVGVIKSHDCIQFILFHVWKNIYILYRDWNFVDTFTTQSEWPYLVCTHCPDDIFQIRRVESAEPLTTVSSSSL